MRLVIAVALLVTWASMWANPLQARGDCIDPFPLRNQLPPAGIFLELTALPPCTVARSQLVLRSWLQVSNTSYQRNQGRVAIVIDHERRELHALLHYGLTAGSDLSLELAGVSDGTGELDPVIENFHALSNASQGTRDNRPRDRFEYSQTDHRTGRQIRVTQPVAGLAEPVITFRHRGGQFDWLWWREVIWGWRAAVKLPIGAVSPAIGSGALDLGGGAMLDAVLDTPLGAIAMFGHAGAVYLSETDATVFDSLHWVAMGGGGFAMPNSTGITPMVQWQFATPRYADVPFALLGRPQDLFMAGAHVRWRKLRLFFGITEDPNTTSEDFSLFAGVGSDLIGNGEE